MASSHVFLVAARVCSRVTCFHEGHEDEKSAVIDLNLTLAADLSGGGGGGLILGSIAMDQMLHSVQGRNYYHQGIASIQRGLA
jgi:hypothetical protein